MAAKKIAGVDRKVFIVAAIGVVLVGLYLRSRANAASSTSAAAPSGSTMDSGLGTGGAGAAAATPTSNGLGSDAVGTQALLDSYAGLIGTLAQETVGLAANAGTYINSSTNGSYNTYYNGVASGAPSSPVTTYGGTASAPTGSGTASPNSSHPFGDPTLTVTNPVVAEALAAHRAPPGGF